MIPPSTGSGSLLKLRMILSAMSGCIECMISGGNGFTLFFFVAIEAKTFNRSTSLQIVTVLSIDIIIFIAVSLCLLERILFFSSASNAFNSGEMSISKPIVCS